jgi:hypothetical protein
MVSKKLDEFIPSEELKITIHGEKLAEQLQKFTALGENLINAISTNQSSQGLRSASIARRVASSEAIKTATKYERLKEDLKPAVLSSAIAR